MSDANALALTATAGRVTVFGLDDLNETDVSGIEIISQGDFGHVSVNPDNSLALVLSGTTETTDLSFSVRITHADATTEVKTFNVNLVEGSQAGGWGQGNHYLLETDAQDRIVVEHGENHRKVYVSGSDSALSLSDIAVRENLSVDKITDSFLAAHPEYGSSPDMALAEDAAALLWNKISNQRVDPHSNWLLFERGHTYDTIKINPSDYMQGESELHPVYVGAWGTGEDPVIDVNTRFIQVGSENIVFQDLHFTGGFSVMNGDNFIFDHVTVSEDSISLQNLNGGTLRNSSVYDVVRDTPVTDSDIWEPHWNRESGLYVSHSDSFLLESTFFDHNAWADDYRQDLSIEGGMPPSMYSHNIYLQYNNIDVTVRDNIIMRGASDGVQVRSGGLIEDNLILDNNSNTMFGYGETGATGNYTIFSGNVVTSAGYKTADAGIAAVSAGLSIEGNMATLVDSIIAHLADPNNPIEQALKERTNWAMNEDYDVAPFFNNTKIYNWEGTNTASGTNDRNLEGLDTGVLDQTTIQIFTAQLLGKETATIADLADYLRAQPGGDKLGGMVDADLIIAFFREGFGIETDLRAEAATLRFVPTEISDGVRWDNRLNWDSGDLPGTQDGDSVDLGGNLVHYGGTTQLAGLAFGQDGILHVNQGLLGVAGPVSVDPTGAQLNIDGAGQVWLDGYSDLDVLKIDAAGGRFANTGLSLGNIRMDVSDNAQVILATDGAEYIMRARSKLTVTGGEARVGFDGVAGGTAALLLTEGADLRFVAEGGKIGTIEEFYSGRYEQGGSGVRSGVNLGGATLEVDVSDVAALGQGSFELIHVDELIGSFGTINIIGLAGNQAAKVVIDYSADKVMLHLGALGSGNGIATLQTVGEPSDAKADAGLYAVLTDGHGVYPVARPDGGFEDTQGGSENNDKLRGSMGNSEIKGFAGDDTIRGHAGDDTLYGGAGNDTLYGNRHADILIGNAGNDLLVGGLARDELIGGRGDDMLWGGRGNDRLTGGADSDVFGFADSFGRDRITDFQIGMDKIQLDYAGASFEDLLIRARGADTVIESSQGVIVLEGVAFGDLTVSDFLF